MRSFAEEKQSGTFEFLVTKPLSSFQIMMAKFASYSTMVLFCLLPTIIYYFTILQLAQTSADVDTGGIIGSYTGLIFLCLSFVAIGTFASSISTNQISAFIIGSLLCFFCYLGFDLVSRLPAFLGRTDYFIQQIGIESHYRAMSSGLIDSRDVYYFAGLISIFTTLTWVFIERIKGE